MTMEKEVQHEADLINSINLDEISDSPENSSMHSPKIRNAPFKSDKDFIFGKCLGEGSFSSVYLAKDINSEKEYAIKVCTKTMIKKMGKVEQICREKEVMKILTENYSPSVPFFVKLYFTFKDGIRLYFVMSYCKNGELLNLIKKLGSFDNESCKFYSAEILRALEYLHSLNIIHRDIKPENILLDERMHIKIADFGSAKILSKESGQLSRKRSLDGTAQYVSPEVLKSKPLTPAADLWALGCVIYQMVSGLPPFNDKSEWLIFQKILKLQYEFPRGFFEFAKDLVQKLLVLESSERLGSRDTDGYPSIRSHPFFSNISFNDLHEQTPPEPTTSVPDLEDDEVNWAGAPGVDAYELGMIFSSQISSSPESSHSINFNHNVRPPENVTLKKPTIELKMSEDERKTRLDEQARNNQWHRFVEGNLILKQGFIDKRKGLFPRRRMFLLTSGPHLYYVDPVNMILKGEIPWYPTIRPQIKNFKAFLVHTPNRTYVLEDPEATALAWCKAIENVRDFYFPSSNST